MCAHPNSLAKRFELPCLEAFGTHARFIRTPVYWSYAQDVGIECMPVDLLIGSNNWLERLARTIGSYNLGSVKNLFAGKILEILWIENSIVIIRSSERVHCLSVPREWLLMGSSISVSPYPCSSVSYPAQYASFYAYRRYYRQCCAYPRAWLKPVAVNLSFVFFCSVYCAPPLHHTIEALLRRGVRGVDALRILQIGISLKRCRIYKRIAILERLPTVQQQTTPLL